MKIKQLFYDKKSFLNCFKHPYVIKEKVGFSPFFENQIIMQGVPDHLYDENYYGVWSHKASLKIKSAGNPRFSLEELRLKLSKNKTFDVIGFNHKQKNMLIFTGWKRDKLENYTLQICNELGLKYTIGGRTRFPVMSNHFLARPQVFNLYVETCLLPAVQLIEEKREWGIWQKFDYDLGVKGIEYTFIPFVLEKMFSIWLNNNKTIKCQFYKNL